MNKTFLFKGSTFIKKLWCCVGGKSITGEFSIINLVDNVNWPPQIVSKLTFRALALCQTPSDEGPRSKRQVGNSLLWQIYVINSVGNTKLHFHTFR